ncbi:hypothetical protein [Wukongibacter sp. M2B1]|uniref:hypothetical protein n=1 Tax=Wukongibacter sp. M2B1 TaxID=3088895 RepID=UPI003D79506A
MTRKTVMTTIALIIIFSILLILLSFDYETKIKVKRKNVENIYFTGKIFNYYILGNRCISNPFKSKILGFSKKKAKVVGLLESQTKNYIVFTKENVITTYVIEECGLKNYEIGKGSNIISFHISDINNDTNDELLIITGQNSQGFGENLIIFSLDKGLREIYKRHFEALNPWKVETCDVDGDDIKEISIGVYKKAQFHPVMAKRPFIYNWHGNDISPKWRGSRLARPFEDYTFADIDGDGLDEIIAIENLENHRKIVSTYKWKGFGFEGRVESNQYEEILNIQRVNNEGDKDDIAVKIENGNGPEWILLHYSNEKLEMKKKLKEHILEVKVK